MHITVPPPPLPSKWQKKKESRHKSTPDHSVFAFISWLSAFDSHLFGFLKSAAFSFYCCYNKLRQLEGTVWRFKKSMTKRGGCGVCSFGVAVAVLSVKSNAAELPILSRPSSLSLSQEHRVRSTRCRKAAVPGAFFFYSNFNSRKKKGGGGAGRGDDPKAHLSGFYFA